MPVEQLVFYGLATMISLCSLMVIASKNPVVSAVFLVLDLFLLAGVFATMQAHFVAVVQVLVYAGAIVVLFMFVIMLINLSPEDNPVKKITPPEIFSMAFVVFGFILMANMIREGVPTVASGPFTFDAIEQMGGNTHAVGMVLFTKYLWPFELASILILLAIVASVVIAKKDLVKKGG
jgi:NADH-quinone oxidoreductase subunit J